MIQIVYLSVYVDSHYRIKNLNSTCFNFVSGSVNINTASHFSVNCLMPLYIFRK